jgi:hypothetical protein
VYPQAQLGQLFFFKEVILAWCKGFRKIKKKKQQIGGWGREVKFVQFSSASCLRNKTLGNYYLEPL